jgi:tRNA nucleotidyltransferase (CCA-adding enzyme)
VASLVIESIPIGALEILETLQGAGYEAYLVGGCVRDGLLGRPVNDWDITTSAVPESVTALFQRVIPTGISHGTVTVLVNGDAYEVTTYRIDVGYSDGRRPDSIQFTRSLEEDLARRDFTINAMAFDGRSGLLVDPFGGQIDLAKRCIRAVGRAEDRLSEDGLRALRAVRFASQLNFEINQDLYVAIGSTLDIVAKVSAERNCIELRKVLMSPRPDWGMRTLRETGLLETFLPDLLGEGSSDFEFYVNALPRVKPDWVYRLGTLCLINPDQVRAICRSLKVANKTREMAVDLVRLSRERIELRQPEDVFRLVAQVGLRHWADFLAFRVAIDASESSKIDGLCQQARDLKVGEGPLSTSDLAITGRVVMEELRLTPSAQIGLVLNGALTQIWCGRLKNERVDLIAALPSILAGIQEKA